MRTAVLGETARTRKPSGETGGQHRKDAGTEAGATESKFRQGGQGNTDDADIK